MMRNYQRAMLTGHLINSLQMAVYWIIPAQYGARIAGILYVSVAKFVVCPFLPHNSYEVMILIKAVGNGCEIIPLVICKEFRVIGQGEDVQKGFILGKGIKLFRASQTI